MRSYLYFLLMLAAFFLCESCDDKKDKDHEKDKKDPLPSWNDTQIKSQLIDYVKKAKNEIPKDDRVAVFDMDGTIACEAPLWFEMAIAVQGMVDQLKQDPALISKTEYKYAQLLSQNPNDTTVTNHWVVDGVNYLDSIVLKAFAGKTSEEYISYAKNYLTTTQAPRFDRPYAQLFYQPMLELLEYLDDAKFKVYIVSGSLSGTVWSICPQTLDMDRDQLIGTRQVKIPVYGPEGAKFVLQKNIYQPKNDGNGKSVNIYDQIGKIPVFAFGNTAGDFGMFHLASSSPYPHMALMLNHDDPEREYAYPPYHGKAVPAWQDSMRVNSWITVDMKSEFKTVWMDTHKTDKKDKKHKKEKKSHKDKD
ncbi:MAG: hypothetical protein ACRC77_01715 [Bacteroidales bacterium]